MANPSRDARDKVQEKWPGATVQSRGRNWIKHQHPTIPNRFSIDSHIAPIHYGVSEDAEIDTEWIPGEIEDQPWLWKMTKADFNVYIGPGTMDFDAGQIVRYVHPDSGEAVTFQPQAIQWTNDLDQISQVADPQTIGHSSIEDDTIYWDGAFGTDLDFKWQAQTSRLAKYLTIQNANAIGSPPQFIIDGGNPVLRIQFLFSKSNNIDIYIDDVLWDERGNNPQTTSGDVEFRLGNDALWWFKQALVRDNSDGEPIPIIKQRFTAQASNLFSVEILVPWSWLETAIYPVVIDPTVDYQVGGSSSDAHQRVDGGSFNTTNSEIWIRSRSISTNVYSGGFHFSGVAIPQGSTIDTAYQEWYISGGIYDDWYFNFRANNVDNADDFAETADIINRAVTTASVLFGADSASDLGIGWHGSTVEIKSVIQEIVDRGSFASGNDIVTICFGINSVTGSLYFQPDAYDVSSTNASKLHIEYTEGGGPSVSIPVIMHHRRQQGVS